jgi:hypothetical protein
VAEGAIALWGICENDPVAFLRFWVLAGMVRTCGVLRVALNFPFAIAVLNMKHIHHISSHGRNFMDNIPADFFVTSNLTDEQVLKDTETYLDDRIYMLESDEIHAVRDMCRSWFRAAAANIPRAYQRR